ncbi:DUF4386 domain-containing protein [Phenylobacterium sp.]|uniref:DUF4386 domain-containing protein n=1 Tax=Phenylobacterium sp. TaxID=1871053 RepID=UPI0027363638|nr:DUF4386 domain-containing protein [Phenylobacterium sp.]MDP3635611.1 DUF4386 domain-containing protein [Phenylobacterium sp.]MDZ4053480.1 DUF4386 domain-containing protein [Phenylobacterium sp.]
MTRRTFESHPNAYLRIAGVIYLLVIVFGGFSEGFVMSALIVSGDPAATARNITGSPVLWNLSLAGNLVIPLIAVPQMLIEYLLLRPVNRNLALLFLLLNAISLAVECVSKLFLLMVVPILGSSDGAFDPQQIQALASVALIGHNLAFHITLIFFGAACLVSGYLIFRSGYLPRLLGLLVQAAGASYLIATFSRLFAPAFADQLTSAILLPALIGESAFCLWLLLKGVNLTAWRGRITSQAQPA